MSAVLIVAAVLAYVSSAGFVMGRANRVYRGNCKDCSKGYSCYRDHTAAFLFTGILWPISIPLLLSAKLGAKDRTARLEAKRDAELEQARHDSKVAAERRREAEELSRELRALGVKA